MSTSDLAVAEIALIKSLRDVIVHGHGRITIEVRDGKPQMIEKTEKIKVS